MKRKTEIVTLRKGKTPLVAVPNWVLDSIDPKMFAGHPKDSYYFRVSIKGNTISYTPIYFAGAHGCKVCDGDKP